jgi:serine/threonine-protein kinase
MRIGLERESAAAPDDPQTPRSSSNPPAHVRSHETIIELGIEAAPVHEAAEPVDPSGRLVFLGEIARGGVGVVLWGRDTKLGRDLALKVLQQKHRDYPEMIQRFVEEARIAGQLQHPGIVPVHDLGTLGDGRPYFSMKLVKGRTLAEILAERSESQTSSAHLLAIYLQVAQTVAYAHEHGVIHRDLKPSNIMVGKYGEVQVMDWGLAKVLPRASGESRCAVDSSHPAIERMEDLGSARDEAFMGTPDYMAPEQFGNSGRGDERTDVFALGAILFEILTGRSVYSGLTSGDVRASAARGELRPALENLVDCGADGELIGLARDCLAGDRTARPRNAGAIAARLSAHLEGMQERLRQAELARFEAQARAVKERTQRRLAVAIATLLILLVVLGGGTAVYYSQQRQQTLARAAAAVREVELRRDEAASDPTGEPTRWGAAQMAIRQARITLQGVDHAKSHQRLRALIDEVECERARAEGDQRLLGLLDFARARADEGLSDEADGLFESAFRGAGLDIVRSARDALGRAIASRPRDVAQAMVGGFDRWAIVRRDLAGFDKNVESRWRVPLDVAEVADPDPWRNKMRVAMWARDGESLARMARSADMNRLPAASLRLMGRLLLWNEQFVMAKQFLTRARSIYPGDYWINVDLGYAMKCPPSNPELALTYGACAVALRPSSAMARMRLGLRFWLTDLEVAEAEIREALRIWPDYPFARLNLAKVLAQRGNLKEAAKEYRAAIRLSLGFAEGIRLRLGEALIELGEPKAVEAQLKTRHERYEYWHALGIVRIRRGDGHGASEALRRADALAEAKTPEEGETADALKQAAQLERLLAVLRGEAQPVNSGDGIFLAQICENYQWLAGAARLYGEVLAKDATLAHTHGQGHFVHAARYAARAGTEPTDDKPPLDDASKARLRGQALGWLRAEIDNWTRHITPEKPETRHHVAEIFRNWKQDPGFAGVRDMKALEGLPVGERQEWRAFWDKIDSYIRSDEGQFHIGRDCSTSNGTRREWRYAQARSDSWHYCSRLASDRRRLH